MTRDAKRRAAWLSLACACSVGCRPKASPAQCDELVERYAQLVVTERFPEASAQQIASEQQREKNEARADNALKNCISEVSHSKLECAMRAPSADALEKCLE